MNFNCSDCDQEFRTKGSSMRHFKEKHAEVVILYTCPYCCSFTNVRKNRTTAHISECQYNRTTAHISECQYNTGNSPLPFVHKVSRRLFTQLFTVLGSDELKDELTSADKKAALTLTFVKNSDLSK